MTRHDYQQMSAGYAAPTAEQAYLVKFPWTGHEVIVRAADGDDAARKAQQYVEIRGWAHSDALAMYSTQTPKCAQCLGGPACAQWPDCEDDE